MHLEDLTAKVIIHQAIRCPYTSKANCWCQLIPYKSVIASKALIPL